jgi:hypothetical protein
MTEIGSYKLKSIKLLPVSEIPLRFSETMAETFYIHVTTWITDSFTLNGRDPKFQITVTYFFSLEIKTLV